MAASTHAGLRPGGSRLACVLPVTLVFLVGVVSGAVAMNLGAHKWLHPPPVPFGNEASKEIALQRWKKQLDLTPEQSQEMTVILDDFGTYYLNVVSDAKARILRILNEDQRRKFNNLLSEQQP